MADYSGNTTGNITAVDGDTFGNTGTSLTIQNGHTVTVTAGATVTSKQNISINSGGTFLVNAGATIKVADNKTVPSVAGGTFTCVGTAAAPITFKSNTTDAIISSWSAFCGITANNASINVSYTIVQNCASVCPFQNNYTGVSFTVNKLWLKNVQYGFNDNAANTATTTVSNLIAENVQDLRLGLGAATASRTINTAYLILTTASFQGTIGTTAVNDFVSIPYGSNGFLAQGGAVTATISDAYVEGCGYGVSVNAASNTITMQRCVLYKGNRGIQNDRAGATTTSSYNDITELYSSAFVTNNASAAINSDYDYVCGNNRKPLDLVDTGSPGTQSTQTLGTITRTNQASTPNKPLTIDNISVGTPTTSSVTITFDSAAGATGYRRKGIGFVKYGTVSGTYNMSTAPEFSNLDLAKHWTQWDTTYAFNTTGHSVTLNNLKSGTTYYACPCFVDPLGLVAVGAEQTFTTTSLSGPFPRNMGEG